VCVVVDVGVSGHEVPQQPDRRQGCLVDVVQPAGREAKLVEQIVSKPGTASQVEGGKGSKA
jgi:hypothetical protein